MSEEVYPHVREGYKILLDHQFDVLKDEVNERIKKWHELKIEYVFLNETSATPFGYLFKEAWKQAYPEEKVPKFYRIDPRTLGYSGTEQNTRPEQVLNPAVLRDPRYQEKLKSYMQKRIKNKDAKLVIFDEYSLSHKSMGFVKNALIKFGGIAEENILEDGGQIDPEYYNETWFPTLGPTIGISNLTKRRIEEKDMYRVKPEQIKFTGDINKTVKQEYWQTHTMFDSKGKYIKNGLKPKKFKSLDYIKDLKKAGKEAGEELYEELEKKKKLEQIVSVSSIICGFLGSMFFFISNITGNAVANINQNSNNLIGAIFLLIGLIGTFFFIKRK